MMTTPQLSIESFPAWARLQDVVFGGVCIDKVPAKGYGLLATKAFDPTENEEEHPAIIQVPADLILSANAVDEYAKVDQNFHALLEAFRPQTQRHKILLYLFAHYISQKQMPDGARRCIATPWSKYIQFLPLHIPVPTMWTEPNRLLLQGTSLENALAAKLAALNSEFDQLQDISSNLPFWNNLFGDNGSAAGADWILMDAWYRSRCLELPHAGTAMVPALDMVNHSEAPTAYYDEDPDGNVVLQVRPGHTISENQEVCISYGNTKPAAEMLFSYGFIDEESSASQFTLPIDTFEDDPLAKAKLHIFNAPPTVNFVFDDTERRWDSPFIHLMCLNEEDGLEFRLLQDPAGDRELRLFWQDQDVTDKAQSFDSLIQTHPLRAIFLLRAVVALQELVRTQAQRLESGPDVGQLESLVDAGIIGRDNLEVVATLKRKEAGLLDSAAAMLELQKKQLLEDEAVVAYLGSKEASQNEQAPPSPANDDVDFS